MTAHSSATHDPLCPIDAHPDWDECVHCELIKKVRADTLEKAGQRFAAAELTYGDSVGISEQGQEMLDVMRNAVLRGES